MTDEPEDATTHYMEATARMRERAEKAERELAQMREDQDHLIDAALIRHSSSKGPMFVRCAECAGLLVNGTSITWDRPLGHRGECSIIHLLTLERAQAKFDAWEPCDWSKHERESIP